MGSEKPRICLAGRVVSGRGEGEFYINLYAREFERVLGFRPYPGTLNIRLEEGSARLRERVTRGLKPRIVHPPRGLRGLADVLCYPAILEGLDVYVVEPQVEGYDKNLLELVAPFSLREKLGLRDGDRVKVILTMYDL
jgi:riboflavin kinase